MAEIRPFKGFRFKLDKKEDLGKLIAPPYDMLDDAGVEQLYASDPHNIVRVDQNRKESSDKSNTDRHMRAAKFLDKWIADGIVATDMEPSVYVYEQHFDADARGVRKGLVRTGVVVLVKLVDFSEGIVQPHEFTLSGPKQDRYDHIEATRVNMGQIFGLVPDSGDLYKLIQSLKTGSAQGVAEDAMKVRHAIYKCDDRDLIERLQGMMKNRTILIADGHHRYETALKFCRDHGNDPAFAYVMMTLVSMADPGLLIRPFHRLIRKGSEELTLDALRKYFNVDSRGDFSIQAICDFLESAGDDMIYADSQTKKLYNVRLSSEGEAFLGSVLPERSQLWKHLDVSKINMIIINTIMGLPLDGHVLHDMIDYMNDPDAALKQLENAETYYGGFFIRPMSIDTVRDIVAGGERMPQKSTNFYPKLFSGLVFNKLGRS